MAIRGTFDHQLNTLAHRVLRMGSLVDEAIELSVRALLERDTTLATRVITDDKVINTLRYDIEEECYTLLALQQPLARDLRVVSAAVTTAVNLERIGDHAAGIAVLARRLNRAPEVVPPLSLAQMEQSVRTMLRHALDAYISLDAEEATAAAAEDKAINRLKEQSVQALLTTMTQSPVHIQQGTYLIWVAHNLERIGDCIKNICERTVYITTATFLDFDRHPEQNEDIDL